jgi:hydrogenase maturation protease
VSLLVIGVGNRDRGDDGAGLEVARRLRELGVGGARLVEQRGEAAELLEAMSGADSVILVDASLSGAHPGTVQRIEAHRETLTQALRCASSHGWGLAEAVELARALGRLPRSVVVYAIEGRCFHPGRDLSPSVRQAVERVARRVRQEIERSQSAPVGSRRCQPQRAAVD